jgi:hypothetical protein
MIFAKNATKYLPPHLILYCWLLFLWAEGAGGRKILFLLILEEKISFPPTHYKTNSVHIIYEIGGTCACGGS